MAKRKSGASPDEVAAAKLLKASWEKKKKRERLSQEQGAEACGWTQANFSHYLNGTNRLNPKAYLILCQYLGEDPAEVYPALFKQLGSPEIDPQHSEARLSRDAIEIGKMVDTLQPAPRRDLRVFVSEYVNGYAAITKVKNAKRRARARKLEGAEE